LNKLLLTGVVTIGFVVERSQEFYSMNNNISVNQLITLSESDSITEYNREKIDLLLEAFNDWPTSVDSLDVFLKETRSFLKIDVLTFNTINSKVKK
jgi:hypothetical protein